MRVCMLVKNSFEFDARVTKEARSLTVAGHEVTVVALHVPGVTERREVRGDGFTVIRVDRIYGRLRDVLPDFLAASTTTPAATLPKTTSPADVTEPPSHVESGPRPIRPAPTSAPRARLSSPLTSRDHNFSHLARRLLRDGLRLAAWPVLLLNDLVVSRRMAAVASASAPHVVHAHDLNTLHVGRRVAQAANAHLIYDAHELHTARNDATRLSRFIARRQERRGIRAADAVITATRTWADMMARSYGIPRPAVVRNMPPRTAVEAPVDLRNRLEIAPEATILLYQGSIQTNRGIEQTIAALPGLPDCVLVICGYGAHRPALEERVAAAGLSQRVRFDGPVPNAELIAYSAGADIGLCLIIGSSESYRTSLPNKLFEYLMAGIPVIASDFPEMGAVVRETGAGTTCDPTDPGAIAAAVDRLRDPERYTEARQSAIRAARDLHWDSEEQVLLSVYARLPP